MPVCLNLDAVHQMAKAIAAANLDVYEVATRAVTEFQQSLANAAAYEPISSIARACADMTRDATAVQLSMVRWILDL
jgi:hypothetical protein